MTENCGDIYGSYTWGNLTWNGAEYDEYYNVFKYTFPEFVQVNMVNPRGWETEDRDQRLWFYRDMHRAVTLGSVLWMGITTACVRRTANIISMAGRWRGSAGNCSRCSRKRAFWMTPGWRLCRTSAMRPAGSLRTGAGMVLAANDTGAPCMLTVHGTAADGACTVKAPDGDAPGVRRDGDALLLALQPGQICGVLFDR